MRFVHVGDLHLGKVIHQYSLIDIQKELIDELLEYMNNEDIRTLVIAGDVYDRSIPSQEAITLLDSFLTKALLEYHIEVFMISGNHDSSDRLHFASSILSHAGLHIETYLKKEMSYIERDNVRFYLLPFVKPSHVKNVMEVSELSNYNDAIAYYLSKQELDKNYKNILVTHQFVGGNSKTSESEVPLSVGGSEIIDPHVFDDYDYVALGHLHASQKVSRETLRYSGSLMRYSFDEVKQNKSIVIVDTDDMSIQLHELHPSSTLMRYEGTFEEIMNPDYILKKDDFLSFELKDTSIIPHAIDHLRVLYPYLLQITYAHLKKEHQSVSISKDVKQEDLPTLFSKFYSDMKNMELNEEQFKVVSELLEEVGEMYENH